MSLALLVVGAVCFYLVGVIWSESGQLAQPMLPLVIVYTVCLVVLAVIGHIVIAIEQNRYSPSLESTFRIARVFGVGLEDVFSWNE
jgi:putative transcriptional regulator